MKHYLKTILGLLIGSVLVFAFSSNTIADSHKRVDRLRAAIIGDESTINPFTYVTGEPGWNILMMQYDSLYTLGIDGQPQPWLVTKLVRSADRLTYTLTLRDDVYYNDGKKLTAHDVKFTFDYLTKYPVGRFAKDIRGFSSANVLNDYKIEIHLKKPRAGYVRKAFADVPIFPRHIWSEVTDPKKHQFESVTNVGSGPYIMVDYKPDQYYRLKANHKYFAGTPRVEELILVKFADESSSHAAFRTNSVDILFKNIPPEQISMLKGIKGVSIVQGPLFTTQLVIMNYDHKPFHMVEVRKAIAYAIDRQKLVDTIYLGAATVGSNGWIHPKSPYFNNQVKTRYNLAKAKSLLDSVGIKDTDGDGIREYEGKPMAFELITPNNNALRLRLAELIKGKLLDVGIKITVGSVEQNTWEGAVWPDFDVNKGRNYAMSMWGWSAGVQADTFRAPELVHSNTGVGFLNLTGVSNKEIDRISNLMDTEDVLARRVELVKQLQAAIAEEMPFITLMYPDGPYAYWSSKYDGLAYISGQGIVNKLSFIPKSAWP